MHDMKKMGGMNKEAHDMHGMGDMHGMMGAGMMGDDMSMEDRQRLMNQRMDMMQQMMEQMLEQQSQMMK